MTDFQWPRRSLAAGEMSPDLQLRSDLQAYRTGAAKVRNFIVRPQGGAERTPGTRLIAEVKNSASATRLIPFKFANLDALMIEAGATYARFFRDKAPVMDGPSPHEVTTIYAAGDLRPIQSVQSADVQWWFSESRTKELRRIQKSPDRFEFVDAVFRNGPFLDRNTDETLSITASAVTGSINLVASDPVFNPLQIGSYFRFDEEDLSDVPKWIGNNAYTANDQVRVGGNVYRAVNSDTSSPNAPSHSEGIEDDGDGLQWEYLHNGSGIVLITGYTDTTHAAGEVQDYRRLPDSVVSAGTWKWYEGAWSDYRGWPKAGALYDNRLIGANTEDLPYWTWWSAIQGFDDFEDGTLDDAGISRPLLSGQVDPIRWMLPGTVMLAATDGVEWYAKPQSGQRAVTPGNLETKPSTVEGAHTVPGVRLGDRALFIDASARRLISWFYDFGTDSYTSEDLSILASHLLAAAVVEVAWQKRPNRVLWCLLRDGTVTGFTYHPKQDVLAWHNHNFGDPVESIAAIPSSSGETDELWMIVNRQLSGVDQRLVEVMEEGFDADRGDAVEDAWYLMSAVQATGSGLTTVSGLDHLEGRSVMPFVDGVQLPPVVVAGGSIALSTAGDKVLVGLAQESYVRTLEVDFGEMAESLYGHRKTLVSIYVSLKQAYGGYVRTVRRIFREALTPSGANVGPPELLTGTIRVAPPESTGDEVAIDVVFDGAYPATITGIMPDWEK